MTLRPGGYSLWKFAAVAGVGVFLGDKLHAYAQNKFPTTFAAPGDTPTQMQTWLGYGVVALGVAGALIAAHAAFGRK